MCGNDATPVGLVEHEKSWASFAKINKNDDTLDYQKDFRFNHPNTKYCGGVFIDA